MQQNLFEYPRWTILLSTENAEEFKEDEFKIISKQKNQFDEEFTILEIEALTVDCPYTADEILDIITDAIAVHEEFTNAIVIRENDLYDLGEDLYTWDGSGEVFLSDMLTDIERLNFLMNYLYEEYKTLVTVDKIKIKLTKDGEPVSLTDNMEKLFTNDVYSSIYENQEDVLWWPEITRHAGLFLVVLNEESDDDERKLLPIPRYADRYDDWDYDDYSYDYGYDYDDRYYRRT